MKVSLEIEAPHWPCIEKDYWAIDCANRDPSSLAYISYLIPFFYNADLLETCDRLGTSTSAPGFVVDDINVFAYGKEYGAKTYRTLAAVHTRKCENAKMRRKKKKKKKG